MSMINDCELDGELADKARAILLITHLHKLLIMVSAYIRFYGAVVT
jgi:hypothetical protein